MPLLLFAYFALEVLAFIGVAKLIGVGWALLAVLGLMVLGGFLASVSLRGALLSAAEGRSTIGKLAGDSALLMVAWVLCMVPGFVTSFAGLLMIFPPTRALMRRSISAQAQRSMEEFGMRAYEASPMSTMRTSYGTFTPEGQMRADAHEDHEVIDADELERWYRMDGPGDTPEGRQP
ncbi:FxsA family protein [Corynebacterium sp. TA-R-1]|uniref:FxsA family protein n=1 Tax=Corynebacterium stercoris TaxID=2943490 RepID=A0ABT1G233_9CORY|nr:FxsA family protein [Corynebacterium stercoris]MCP1387033.1 FxsA family protein [Corynebacterium stercoris]